MKRVRQKIGTLLTTHIIIIANIFEKVKIKFCLYLAKTIIF